MASRESPLVQVTGTILAYGGKGLLLRESLPPTGRLMTAQNTKSRHSVAASSKGRHHQKIPMLQCPSPFIFNGLLQEPDSEEAVPHGG